MSNVSGEQIEKFLEGYDDQKYIVAIEASYGSNEVQLVINDPERGKYIETDTFKPFLYLKHDVSSLIYGGNRMQIKKAMAKHNVKIEALRIDDDNGFVPERMEDGYKYLATTRGSYNDLLNFFKYGGLPVFLPKNERNSAEAKKRPKYFVTFSPDEQYFIQTGKRLFKGMDDYDDVHRLQFDLETTGLLPSVNSIFQIGIRDNRGYERVLEVRGENPKELREAEKEVIIEFFDIIDELKPDIITGYNSENFDWDFIEGRCKRLYIDFETVAKTLNPSVKIKRKDATLKIGSESEDYQQTYMWGTNIIDIWHSVLRAQAINSDIKEAGLKYITKFSGIAKKNRVYVEGDKLHDTWNNLTDDFYYNDGNGDWFKKMLDEDGNMLEWQQEKLKEGEWQIVRGDYIVQRYLLDDLWETEQVDGIFNQAAFLIAKLLPTSYMRSTTMGTAGQWKLIMAAWSYANGLAIPALEEKRSFTGGLSRLLEVGFARGVVKLDFAALYPKTELTHDIFPDLDISGVMKGLLTYVVDTRDRFKFLTGDMKKKAKKLQAQLEAGGLTADEEVKIKEEIKKAKALASMYDKKQLPLKILANSFFGAFGAPYIFNWGDTYCAEETTCRGRQYLRLMVKHFTETHGFRPLVGDTDGFNFAIPDHIDTIKYTCTAKHWKTEKYEAGQELTGLEAVLAEFNEVYMIGRMGLDIDDICSSTINFSRKNYANAIDGKIKLVGNTIKSKKMPKYIEEFLAEGIKLLLVGKGYEFVNLYHDTIDDIYNYRIPLVKIASKSKVKETYTEYEKYCMTKNKAGNYKSRKAHMELAKAHELNINYGDTIYYVNTGTAKSHSDVKKVTDKKTGKVTIELQCKLIPTDQIEKNPDLTTDEYNVAKYIDAFNKRIKPLLVCFSEDIRDEIMLDVKSVTRKDENGKNVKVNGKAVKDLVLSSRPSFTRAQCELGAGKPFKPEDQDSYKDLMTMEDKEILFWTTVNKLPNNMEQEEWDEIVVDYHERMRIARLEAIQAEKDKIDDIFRRFEVKDLEQLRKVGVLPKKLLVFADVAEVDGNHVFYSIEWQVPLAPMLDLFKYEDDAKERMIYYGELGADFDGDRYDAWLNSKENAEFLETIEEVPEDEVVDSIASREAKQAEIPFEVEAKLAEQDIIPEDLTPEGLQEAIDETEYLNSSEANADRLKESIEQLEEGHTITMEDVNNCEDCDDDEWNF